MLAVGISLKKYADVMELADMQDLGSCVERHAGSTPVIRTIAERVGIGPSGFVFCIDEACISPIPLYGLRPQPRYIFPAGGGENILVENKMVPIKWTV